MKRKLITILAIFLPFFGAAQTIIGTGNPNQLTYQRGGYGADSVLAIPVADTSGAGATWANYRKIGRIMVNDADSTLYYHDGVKWRVVGGGGVSDTNFIRNQNAYRQDGNFRINGVGETSRMIVASEEFVPQVENLDTSSYGLFIGKSLDPPYNPTYQGSSAGFLTVFGDHNFSAGDNIRGSLTLYPEYVLDSMTNATGVVKTAGVEIRDQAQAYQMTAERPLIWQNVGILNYSTAAVSTGVPSVDSSVSNYGIISIANWRKGTFSNAEAQRYNLVLSGAPNFISGPTMFSKNDINDIIQTRDGGPAFGLGPSMDSFNQDFSVKILGNMIYKPGTEGAGKILTSSADGTVNISDAAAVIGGEGFLQGGNAFGATAELGTTDNHPLEIKANDNVALTVNTDGTVQYTDGTEGDGKILMSSADGTLSAQSADSVVANSNAWINGLKNFGAASNNHARLWAAQDTVSITSGFGGNTVPVIYIHGRRIAIGDLVRPGTTSFRVVGTSSGTGETPAISMEGRPTDGGSRKIGTLIAVAGYGETVPAVVNLAISRAGTNRPIPHYIGISALNWSASPATTNYFIHSESFQPSSTNWFLFGNAPVKSQLAGNLLLNKVADNGYKLQVGEGGVHVESPDEPEKQLVLTAPFTPGNTADAKGEVGAITWDNDYLYIKTTAGWKRAALSTF